MESVSKVHIMKNIHLHIPHNISLAQKYYKVIENSFLGKDVCKVFLYANDSSPITKILRNIKSNVHFVYVFIPVGKITGPFIRALTNTMHKTNVLLIVDCCGAQIPLQKVKHCTNRKIVSVFLNVNEDDAKTLPHEIKCIQNEDEKLNCCLQSNFYGSPLSFVCDYSSCIGKTIVVDENGRCFDCVAQEEVICSIFDEDLISKFDERLSSQKELLIKEIEFRNKCKNTCKHFSVCKGGCYRKSNRCIKKFEEQKFDESNFDTLNKIYQLSQR